MRPVRPHLVLNLMLCLCGSAGAVQHKEDLTQLPLTTLQQRAEAGEAAALDELGNRYYEGRGVTKNQFTAATWYWRAADQGDPYAENILGEMCQYGRGIALDLTRAAELYGKAADQGNVASQFSLAVMYRDGIGIPANPAAAMLWFQKAAAQGDQKAKDALTALSAPQAPGSRGSPGRSPTVAQQPEDFSKFDIATLTARANAGDAAAQDALGDRYQHAQGVTQDYAQAMKWYRKAADQGHADGEYNVGFLYAHGLGGPTDYAQALIWYGKAAAQGHGNAENNLGFMYQHGQGVVQNYSQALEWFRKGAGHGNNVARTNIGFLYESGFGVAKDDEQAVTWYRMAANEGFAGGESNLGMCYEDGRGVPKDLVQARQWFQKAAAQGEPFARDELAKLDAASPARGFQPETPTSRPVAGVVRIPHNYALIFATDDYAHWPHLTNPISDADAVSQTLTSLYGFHVEELRNTTDDQVLQKLTEYLHRKFEPQDQLLIFFSGHGYFDPDLGKGFLVPANALRVQDDIGHRSLLAHETIMDYVNRIPANHVVLVLDACFSGTLDRRIADSGLRGDTSDVYVHATLPELLERKEPKRTRRYITSGGKDFVPDGLPGHHSPFISAFLVTLNQAADRKGYATLDDIQQGLNTVNPEPRWGDIQDDNDPGADFLLLTPAAISQLTKAN